MTEEAKADAPMTAYQCGHCDWTGTMDTINGIHHLHHIHERVMPGELCPAGACPECGALIEVDDVDVEDNTLRAVARIMWTRGWSIVEPGSVDPG